jgi:hypothetical protein
MGWRISCIWVVLWSSALLASEIEEPAYRLLEALDGVELRYYEPAIQAQTTLGSSGDTSGGFRRLAGFIFGGNDSSKEIAMTAPVQETLHTETPVMAFTMPGEYTLEDLPRPGDSRVVLREIPARIIATIAFSGWATQSKVAEKTEKLLTVLERNHIDPIGTPFLNQYNPPWTLPFLRRNEVAVEVTGLNVSLANQ